MNWHDYDERLIRRGELILDLEFVRNYQTELAAKVAIYNMLVRA